MPGLSLLGRRDTFTQQSSTKHKKMTRSNNLHTEASLSAKLASFTCFPSLPFELRLMIWEYCAYITRILVLDQKKICRIKNKSGTYKNHLTYIHSRSLNPSPPPLRICRESRLAALRMDAYSLIFGDRVTESPLQEIERLGYVPRVLNVFVDYPTVHFNQYVDTVYFSCEHCESLRQAFWSHRHLKLRSVALDLHVLMDGTDPLDELFGIFDDHPLEEVIVVVKKGGTRKRGLSGQLVFVELGNGEDISVGEEGIRRLNEYFLASMERRRPLLTSDMVLDSVLQIENSSAACDKSKPVRHGICERSKVHEKDVDTVEEVSAKKSAPAFRAMGVARGGVRL